MRHDEMNEQVLMPKTLTAENGAKKLLIGEFHLEIELNSPGHCGCGECDYCIEGTDEDFTYTHTVPIPWTTIKSIYAMAVKHLSEPEKPLPELIVCDTCRGAWQGVNEQNDELKCFHCSNIDKCNELKIAHERMQLMLELIDWNAIRIPKTEKEVLSWFGKKYPAPS